MAGFVNRIKRTITLTACIGQRVNAQGEFEDFCDCIAQDVDEAKASNIFRKKYKDQSITINHVEKETSLYWMTVEEFVACAHEGNPKETKKEN